MWCGKRPFRRLPTAALRRVIAHGPYTGRPLRPEYQAGQQLAMEWGGGLDIKLSHNVQFRPVEVDYLFTQFHSNRLSNNQNSFKYFAGVNFTF